MDKKATLSLKNDWSYHCTGKQQSQLNIYNIHQVLSTLFLFIHDCKHVDMKNKQINRLQIENIVQYPV